VGVRCATVALKKKSRKKSRRNIRPYCMQHDEGNSQHSKATSTTFKNNTGKHQTSRSTCATLQHGKKSWRNMMKEIRNIRNIQKITPATVEIYLCNITTLEKIMSQHQLMLRAT
jgi:hypothetical protein